ncbi:MAG: tRNA lysidine(34) synthetase TilS [Betaproteobacteria bacterium]|nr:tRNA lysidine(34) synthetase TilS [Betaproteobacteria bacterium]
MAVAASGGRDSTALLHCTLQAARPLGVEVVALHVHHGLVAEADEWLAQVRNQCRRWGAQFACTRLPGSPARGESVEAWARRERYRALAEMALAEACHLVLLAHHRRDQAETFLLQALRGGGPAGLASMPVAAQRQGLVWARPWLDRPRETIEAYLRRYRLRFVDDASNADPRFARNRLRGQVWPALVGAFPDAEAALTEAARLSAQAAALADEVAALDLPGIGDDSGLRLTPWEALPPARRRNVLQAWLVRVLCAPVPQSLVQRLCEELPGSRSGIWPAPQAELRLYRGQLVCGAIRVRATLLPEAVELDLAQPGQTPLPVWAGFFEVSTTSEGGVDGTLLQRVVAVSRQGGERFRLSPRGAARSLKKQYQTAGVPAWQREGPLLRLPDGRLLFAPGLGFDAALRAAPGAPQLFLRWRPATPGPRQADG